MTSPFKKRLMEQKTKQGVLISLEGIEGCGKGTQIDLLTNFLEAQAIPWQVLREPGTTQLGKEIRKILLNREYEIDEMSELLLFLSARKQLIDEIITPWLKLGTVILLDRFCDSSITYQGWGRDLGAETIEHLHRLAGCDIKPDLTFYLDISYETSLHRQKQRGSSQDHFEKLGPEFFSKVIAGYEDLHARDPDRIKKIDGNKDPDLIHQDIVNTLNS